jgi:hypothetical protein
VRSFNLGRCEFLGAALILVDFPRPASYDNKAKAHVTRRSAVNDRCNRCIGKSQGGCGAK